MVPLRASFPKDLSNEKKNSTFHSTLNNYTSSSSIDYIPKSLTSSTSLSPNGYLNPPTSPPPRVSPPPPTQENASMDITLTLSPITPLDVQFDTPSPSPPILGHPIPWNLLEAQKQFLALSEDINWIEFLLTRPHPPPRVQRDYPSTTASAPNSPSTNN
ncbi:hypothetical protein Tco_1095770 [Tanacetum coccineum]